MALSKTTLSTELAKMVPVATEAAATAALASAYDVYFLESTAGSMPGGIAASPVTSGAVSAMELALAGISTPSLSSAKFQAGILAYWAALNLVAATLFVAVPAATAITPPTTLGLIAGLLDPVFVTNRSGSLSLVDSMDAVADVLHTNSLAGICVFPPTPGGLGPLTII